MIANEITPIDAGTGAVGTPVDVPGGAVRVAAGFGALWVSGTSDMLTYVVPASTQVGVPKLEGIRVGSGPIGVATGAGSVWVANGRGGTVSQVNPHSLRVVRTLRVGGHPLSLAVAGGRVYLGDGQAPTLQSPYPAPASQVLGIGTEPGALLAVGGSVWVAGANPGRVLSVGPDG